MGTILFALKKKVARHVVLLRYITSLVQNENLTDIAANVYCFEIRILFYVIYGLFKNGERNLDCELPSHLVLVDEERVLLWRASSL